MSGLVDLFSQTKTASVHRGDPNCPWEQAAAEFGFASGDDLMDKVASARIHREDAMVKMANAQIHFGECMAAGYWDGLTKIAQADPVRDGIPIEYIKIAQASRQGLAQQLIKLASTGTAVAGVADDALKSGAWNKLIEALNTGKQYVGDAASRGFNASKEGLERGFNAAKNTAKDGWQSAKQAVTGNRAMAQESHYGGKTTSLLPNEIAEGRELVRRGGGQSFTGKAVNPMAMGDELGDMAHRLQVDPQDLMLALRSRGQAAGDAALRLGAPAAGIGAVGTGIGYGLS